jgi:hypothetical protein
LFVNFSRLDDFEKKKNGAPRLGNFIAAHFGRLMMCLIYVCSRRNFGKKKKTSSGKGTENYRCNSVISGSANSSQLQLQLHLYTISSNGSIVFDFSKQLNDQPFAPSKAVDFALVVSTFKAPGINRFGISMP